MKTTIKLIGIIALVAVIGFGVASCDNDNTSRDPDLSGTIAITPSTATTGTELSAAYSGSETATQRCQSLIFKEKT